MRSELENVVLAVLWLKQPCTAYVVRKAFDESISAYWSSSAGSIYPLLRRLRRAGLVATTTRPIDQRAAQLLTLTRQGAAAARNWLTPPLPDPAELIGYDPLRTRMRFLSMMKPAAADRLIDDAHEKLKAALAAVRHAMAKLPVTDVFDRLAHRNAIVTLAARLRWLQEVRSAIRRSRA